MLGRVALSSGKVNPALPPAFVPPAASIRDKPFLGGRQARYHKPCDRTKAVARQFVATHIRSALVSLPDAHVWEEASVVRLECQLLDTKDVEVAFL